MRSTKGRLVALAFASLVAVALAASAQGGKRATTTIVFGTAASVRAALARSAVSRTVNTAFVERHNGTTRNRDARKVRKTYHFSKDWWTHRAATFFSQYSYNFCWPVRTLKEKGGEARTPAMMAKLADHVWTLVEWIKRPAVQLA